jgi:hypothetical protein
LEVVHDDQQRTEGRERAVRCLEDPQRVPSVLIVTSKREQFEAGTAAGYSRQAPEEVSDDGKRYRRIWLEANDPDDRRELLAGKDLREEACLSCPRFTRYEGGNRQSAATAAAR